MHNTLNKQALCAWGKVCNIQSACPLLLWNDTKWISWWQMALNLPPFRNNSAGVSHKAKSNIFLVTYQMHCTIECNPNFLLWHVYLERFTYSPPPLKKKAAQHVELIHDFLDMHDIYGTLISKFSLFCQPSKNKITEASSGPEEAHKGSYISCYLHL